VERLTKKELRALLEFIKECYLICDLRVLRSTLLRSSRRYCYEAVCRTRALTSQLVLSMQPWLLIATVVIGLIVTVPSVTGPKLVLPVPWATMTVKVAPKLLAPELPLSAAVPLPPL
jgi:hypothetical protein